MIKYIKENNELKQMPLDCIKGATLLSKEEAEKRLSSNKKRICKYNGKPYTYWLRTRDDLARWGIRDTCVVYSVNKSGYIYGGYRVDGGSYRWYDPHHPDFYPEDIGVRPALILNLTPKVLKSNSFGVGDMFEFGGYEFKIISRKLAVCEKIIGICPFNKNKEGGSDYETSDVKKYVDDWFHKAFEYERNQQSYKEIGIPTDKDIFNGPKGEWGDW